MNNETNAVEVFNNEEFGSVRTTMIDGEPWFVAADVCEHFGVTNRNRVMQNIDAEDKGGTQIDTPGGMQTVTIVNESGLYAILFALQPSKARGVTEEYIEERQQKLRKFKRWITHDVIPTIRKTGSYLTGEDAAALKIIRAGDTLERSVAIAEYRDVVTAPYKQQIEEQKPKVEFADHVSASENSVDMGEFAKIVQKNGIKLGRNNLFSKLRELKILMDGNLPYQQYMNAGWFEVVEITYERSGTLYVSTKTLVTGKGQITLVRKLRKALAEESTRYIA